MIACFFHINVPPERAQGFEASWKQRMGLVDRMPGFQSVEVLRDGAQPGHYIVLMHWDTKEHYDAWANSPDFVAGHSRTQSGPGGPAPMALEFFEVLPTAASPLTPPHAMRGEGE